MADAPEHDASGDETQAGEHDESGISRTRMRGQYAVKVVSWTGRPRNMMPEIEQEEPAEPE